MDKATANIIPDWMIGNVRTDGRIRLMATVPPYRLSVFEHREFVEWLVFDTNDNTVSARGTEPTVEAATTAAALWVLDAAGER